MFIIANQSVLNTFEDRECDVEIPIIITILEAGFMVEVPEGITIADSFPYNVNLYARIGMSS